MKKTSLLMVALVMLATPAFAGGGEAPPEQHWPHKGAFGTYDRAALQRGFQVYKEVCSACHAVKYLAYRDFEMLGYSPEQVKSLAAEYTVIDGPNDEGDMFERPGRPADRYKGPFANDKAARAANGGALPPDLSMVVKARPHGEDYLFALLTGYEEAPSDVAMMPGLSYNRYFSGHQIAMAPPLSEGQVTYADGTASSLEQQARDVVQFMAWASDPYQDERKRMGAKVVLFLLVFAGIMYAAKRKIWADVH